MVGALAPGQRGELVERGERAGGASRGSRGATSTRCVWRGGGATAGAVGGRRSGRLRAGARGRRPSRPRYRYRSTAGLGCRRSSSTHRPRSRRIDDLPDDLDDVASVVAGHPGDLQDLDGVEPPRSGRHHPDQGDVLVRVGDRAEALLEVADLGRLEQRQPTDDGVRDVLVAEPRDDRLAVPVLAVEDGDVGPGPTFLRP